MQAIRMPLRTISAGLLLAWAGCSVAGLSEDEAELAALYGDKSFISIATGAKQSTTRAPAVATVITAEDIAATGARNVDEALQAVPGMHVSVGYIYDPVYAVRGVHTKYNPQVLMLLNGVPLTNPYLGSRGDGWSTIPAENIARIEVIRGPGSALYGADAFTGVINVITKTSADIDGTLAGARVGSYNNREGWIQHGGKIGPFQLAASLHVGKTDGPDETIASDTQSSLDQLFGTSASYAPGPVQRASDMIDGSIDLAYDKWRLRANYAQRYHAQLGQGVADALDKLGSFNGRRFLTDLNYHDADFAKDWEVSAQASYYERGATTTVYPFPPGAFGGAYPDGMIGTPGRTERTQRLNASGFYTGFQQHRVRLGVGAEKSEIGDITESKNFNIVYIPGVGNVPVPLGGMVDFTNTAPFMKPVSRENLYLFAQDEWQLANDWALTLGLRHDNYSDFGGTTNPRAALVWAVNYNFTAKLLYGRAFRAPSFVEMYAINNPTATGNPELKPETTDTWETAFVWQPNGVSQLGLNLYQYQMQDVLRFVPNSDPTTGATAQNAGKQRGRGFEVEGSWDPTRTVRLSGNYSYQRSVDQQVNQDAGLAPHQKVYLRGDWRVHSDWALNAQYNWLSSRNREPVRPNEAPDTRSPMGAYNTFDLTMTKGTDRSKWSTTIGVRNLFDSHAREPSFAPGSIPEDYPLPGRNWFAQLSYRL